MKEGSEDEKVKIGSRQHWRWIARPLLGVRWMVRMRGHTLGRNVLSNGVMKRAADRADRAEK